ncbi:hypothetical protein CG002_00395 [Mesoplasma florum]|uniref:hypothetical protein n=1 Tax=Mesoplasma florum TaxID=2151 RepID=UPI000D087DE5|nr:hypothetical protein [Mesoplasma florum]AVN64833.1 hypothetical protein CG002_00395 [Mesoplasma florum]
MKKLLSIITALTVAASATSSLVSCKVITNSFDIEITNWETPGELTYKFNKQSKKYEVKADSNKTEVQKKSDVKKALDGVTGTFASTLVSDMINSLFFNANLSVTENSKKTWQYLFENDKGTYSDGQYRTAGFNKTQEQKIDEYYSSVENISSLLGLMQYSEWSTSNSTKTKKNEQSEGSNQPIVIDPETIKLINDSQMFDSSNNQGITNVQIKSTPNLYKGKIGLAQSSSEQKQSGEDESSIKISEYTSDYISEQTNFNEKTANETSDSDATKGYGEYVAGTNIIVDPFSQLLISKEKESPEIAIQVKEVKEQSETSKENYNKKQGLVLNSEDAQKSDEPITFEYTKNDKGVKTGYAYGYTLVSLEPIDLQLTYNDNRDLKTGKENGKDYVIDLTIDGLSAAFKPILGFTSNKDKDDKQTSFDGIPYVGWRFMGYQFNSKNIVSYNDDGSAITVTPPDKKMTKSNKKFNEFNITKFEFKEK